MPKTKPLTMLKGQKNGIAVQLDSGADFNLITEDLRRKVNDAREFFAGANTNVIFKGRTLSEEEEKNLLDIILSETTLNVSFVASEGFNAAAKQEPEEEAADISAPPVKNISRMEQNTVYYRHGLRSGQAIHFDGSVVVQGDVNAGSEIVAKGNIIVLGAVRGMVHAGSGGDSTCFISAHTLTPTQLRIANIITSIQTDPAEKKKPRHPEYAYIKDGQVYVVRH